MTDHPIYKEIIEFKALYPQIRDIYWDKNSKIGRLILSPTPIYVIIKHGKIIDAGIVAAAHAYKKYTFAKYFLGKLERIYGLKFQTQKGR